MITTERPLGQLLFPEVWDDVHGLQRAETPYRTLCDLADEAGWDDHHPEVKLALDMQKMNLESAKRGGYFVFRVGTDGDFICERETDDGWTTSVILEEKLMKRVWNARLKATVDKMDIPELAKGDVRTYGVRGQDDARKIKKATDKFNFTFRTDSE